MKQVGIIVNLPHFQESTINDNIFNGPPIHEYGKLFGRIPFLLSRFCFSESTFCTAFFCTTYEGLWKFRDTFAFAKHHKRLRELLSAVTLIQHLFHFCRIIQELVRCIGLFSRVLQL